MKVYVVTYCSEHAEYNNQISIEKVFSSKSAAEQYVLEGQEECHGDYDILEKELVED